MGGHVSELLVLAVSGLYYCDIPYIRIHGCNSGRVAIIK